MTAKHAPTSAPRVPAAAPPEVAPETAVRQRFQAPPMPRHLAEAEAETPLQVRIPASLHRAFKVETAMNGETMADIAAQLISLYVETPDEIREAIQEAAAAGRSLGEHFAERLRLTAERQATGDDPAPAPQCAG